MIDERYTLPTKKDRPMRRGTALTDNRKQRLPATYSIYSAARPRLAERRSGAEDSFSSPGQTSPTDLVSGFARLTPRTRPCPAREGGPRVAHTRHQGPYPRDDAYRDSDGHLRTWLGRSAPAPVLGMVNV